MTISTAATPYHNYTGNGAVDDFAVTNFKILRNSNNTHAIRVYKTVIATGIATLLAETTDYTVALDTTSPSTGTVTLVAGNLPATHRISIIPSLPDSQEVNLQNAAVIDVEDIESALDKLTLITQELQENISRAIVFGPDSLERDTQMTNLTSAQVDNLITQLNTIATSDNSVSDFSIDSLDSGTLDITADYIPFHDTATNTIKKSLIPSSSTFDGIIDDVQVSNMAGDDTVVVSAGSTWYDIPTLSVTTTPTTIYNKVLIGGFINISGGNGNTPVIRIKRSDGKILDGYIHAGARDHCIGATGTGTTFMSLIPIHFLEEEVGTTSAVTYTLQINDPAGGDTFKINRLTTDADAPEQVRTVSQLYLMRFI